MLVGAGNTELFTYDVLGLDNKEHKDVQSVVDEYANLISKQIQHDFFIEPEGATPPKSS